MKIEWLNPNLSRFAVFLLLFGLAQAAFAAMTIQVFGGAATRIPVSIVPFAGAPGPAQVISSVVGGDLSRSGQFRLVDASSVQPSPTDAGDVQFPAFRALGSDAAVIGRIVPLPDGRLEVRFRLMDAVKQSQVAALNFTITPAQLRATGHKIADVVYEKLTGVPGSFSTRLAYITKQGKHYQLLVADSDGQDPQVVVNSTQPLISPAWSPDGSRIAYVSFENKKPVIYIQSLATGSRRVLANFKGSNSAPAWAPDGSKLAVVLTRDNGSQIYTINANGSGVTRLTHGGNIDTEPTWSPDGKSILFTSDRGGSPQIYRMAADGGDVKRVTFEGNYNVSPAWSPDGKSFAYIRRDAGRFQVALQNIDSGQVQVLTDTTHDESPSFAPNGSMIVYATEINGRGILATVSVDGKTRVRLSDQNGDMREPAWGPKN
ncbi:MAG: Tol-Pal system beta propeller repeat protein TolB [Sulfuriferula sp.]